MDNSSGGPDLVLNDEISYIENKIKELEKLNAEHNNKNIEELKKLLEERKLLREKKIIELIVAQENELKCREERVYFNEWYPAAASASVTNSGTKYVTSLLQPVDEKGHAPNLQDKKSKWQF